MIVVQTLGVIGFVAALAGLAPPLRGSAVVGPTGRVSRKWMPLSADAEIRDRYPEPMRFLLPPPALVFWGMILAMVAVAAGFLL